MKFDFTEDMEDRTVPELGRLVTEEARIGTREWNHPTILLERLVT